MTPISIQLYTLRDEAHKDFFGVLRMLAETGYKAVEFAGLHDKSAAEIAGVLKDLGLETSSSHVSLPSPENINEIVDRETTLGNTRLVAGFGPDDFKTLDDCKRSAEQFQRASELANAHGFTFGMHNHWWEFETIEGRLVYDFVLENAPNMFSELDVYWAAVAGLDPAAVVAQHKGRLPLLHIKDGSKNKDDAMTAVGSGTLNMPAIIQAADPATLKYLVVELDRCDTDMTEAVKQSYRYLTSNGLASGNK